MTTHLKKVLIIEDDKMLQQVLLSQFTKEGFNAVVAHDGEEGLDKIFSEKPDAIILDMVMPKMDGLQVLEEFRKKDPENKTPVIVLTNAQQMEYLAGAMSHNVAAYLVKSEQQLSNIVEVVKSKLL